VEFLTSLVEILPRTVHGNTELQGTALYTSCLKAAVAEFR